jgi:hypothetical protein
VNSIFSCIVATPALVGKEHTKQEQIQQLPQRSHHLHLLPFSSSPRLARSHPPFKTTLFPFPRECEEKRSSPFSNTLSSPMFVSSLALLALASIPALAQFNPTNNNVTSIGGTWSSGSQSVVTGSVRNVVWRSCTNSRSFVGISIGVCKSSKPQLRLSCCDRYLLFFVRSPLLLYKMPSSYFF